MSARTPTTATSGGPAAGCWANYTRTYPAGLYYVYARAASPSGQADGVSLLRVTSGLGTTTQTTTPLGIFNIPLTGGYQTYTFTPLVNSNGNLMTITNSGAVSTLRMNEDNGGYNLNFFMLVPASLAPKLSVSLSGGNIIITWTPVVGQLYASPALAGPNVDWQPVAGGTTGSNTIPATGNGQFFRVRSPGWPIKGATSLIQREPRRSPRLSFGRVNPGLPNSRAR